MSLYWNENKNSCCLVKMHYFIASSKGRTKDQKNIIITYVCDKEILTCLLSNVQLTMFQYLLFMRVQLHPVISQILISSVFVSSLLVFFLWASHFSKHAQNTTNTDIEKTHHHCTHPAPIVVVESDEMSYLQLHGYSLFLRNMIKINANIWQNETHLKELMNFYVSLMFKDKIQHFLPIFLSFN